MYQLDVYCDSLSEPICEITGSLDGISKFLNNITMKNVYFKAYILENHKSEQITIEDYLNDIYRR